MPGPFPITLSEPQYYAPATQLEIKLGAFTIILRIEGHLQLRTRRALVLVLYRKIRSALKELPFNLSYEPDAWIHQNDGKMWNFDLERDRGVSLRQACNVDSASEKTGFKIRYRRLESGLTQDQLADVCGISRRHLGRIEKGKVKITSAILQKIEAALTDSR